MPRMITLQIQGADRIIDKLRVLGRDFPRAAGNALFRWASQHVEKPAKERYVPVMFGALRSSIRTLDPVVTLQNIYVTVAAGGAAAPYALAVHENPRAGRTGGLSPSGKRYKNFARIGQWKYLETPAIEAASRKGAELAKECGIELDRVIHGLR